jgi:hypothetical protein
MPMRTRHEALFAEALRLMQRDGCTLMRIHGPAGGYFLTGGKQVTDAVGERLIAHPQIHGSDDGLFAGCSQTWIFDDDHEEKKPGRW